MASAAGSRECKSTEKGAAYSIELVTVKYNKLYTRLYKLIEETRSMLVACNLSENCRDQLDKLSLVELSLVEVFESDSDVFDGAKHREIINFAQECSTWLNERIEALDTAARSRATTGTRCSVTSHRSYIEDVREEAALSEVDIKYTQRELNLESELRQLKLKRCIERGQVLSKVRESSVDENRDIKCTDTSVESCCRIYPVVPSTLRPSANTFLPINTVSLAAHTNMSGNEPAKLQHVKVSGSSHTPQSHQRKQVQAPSSLPNDQPIISF